MMLTSKKINFYTFFKLPAAWWSGVRVTTLTSKTCETYVRYSWRNQNPFKSMYFAVQAMAAELSTGALILKQLEEKELKVSMLVLGMKSKYFKKAVGKIKFSCLDGDKIGHSLLELNTKKSICTCILTANGYDEEGDLVANFEFEWTFKLK
ncbi:DUF4442 domain-containing protein [Mesonia sp. HuA40]|uniref:DUF4442 domain-containing protein n=1 Tax=Mesonia sp. HuA40 TaxID=2602761 RepID=UPI0011C72FE4|nr:DUF4442 domain-containing protein [Mesonia sp. HuA40]TXK70248.1 DUF4442 domain-containing protein [Mesonia sp. HuA40]